MLPNSSQPARRNSSLTRFADAHMNGSQLRRESYVHIRLGSRAPWVAMQLPGGRGPSIGKHGDRCTALDNLRNAASSVLCTQLLQHVRTPSLHRPNVDGFAASWGLPMVRRAAL